MLLTVRNVWASDLEGDFCQFLFELFGEVILENKEGKEIPHTCIIIMTHVNREKYLNEYTFWKNGNTICCDGVKKVMEYIHPEMCPPGCAENFSKQWIQVGQVSQIHLLVQMNHLL